jgi:hypothetical protein
MPVGGGVEDFSAPVSEEGIGISSSYPIGSRWHVSVSNVGRIHDADFQVAAVCVQPGTSYQVDATAVDDPPGPQVSTMARCPGLGQLPGGGGASISGGWLFANVASSFPYAYRAFVGWAASASNTSAYDAGLTAYAICDRSLAVGVVKSAPLGVAPLSFNFGEADCPGTQVPLSGGVDILTRDSDVTVDDSYPGGNTWQAMVRNNSPNTIQFVVYAVCAGS